jgi:hypothetical protein
MPPLVVVPAVPPAPVAPPVVAPVPLAAPVPPPAALAPADVPGVPHHVVPTGPLLGEQFGPLTVTTPGVPR